MILIVQYQAPFLIKFWFISSEFQPNSDTNTYDNDTGKKKDPSLA